MNEKTWCIYVHTNKTNGKKYVGQTIYTENPDKRWNGGEGYKTNRIFYNSIVLRGWNDGYTHEIIENNITSREEANRLEKYYIIFYNSKHPNGYNLTDGGEGSFGYKWTKEQKIKLQGENHKNYGKHLSKETREKIRNAQLGKIISDESKRNMSLSKKGKSSPHKLKIFQYDLNGNFIKEWESSYDVAKEYKCTEKVIAKACRKDIKSSCGYQWSYKFSEKIEAYNPTKPSRKSQSIKIAEVDDCGNIIKEYNCIREASREINTCNSNIKAVLLGKFKQIKGHKYIYI